MQKKCHVGSIPLIEVDNSARELIKVNLTKLLPGCRHQHIKTASYSHSS